VGCGSSVPIGVWSGYVVRENLQTDPRGAGVTRYQAASLRVVDGPAMLAVDTADVDKAGKSTGTRILVNEEDRILDPAAFGAGLVHVEGTSTGLWGACDAAGHWLYYDPPRRATDWVEEVIRVKRATDSAGKGIQLEVAKRVP
jgi:hypothetical protein